MSNIPAHLLRRGSSGLAEDLAGGLSQGRSPTLSIANKEFKLIDAAGNERPAGMFDQATRQLYVDVIIVDGNRSLSKKYYKDAYDPTSEDFKAPTCWSDNGVGPSVQSSEPQSTTCAACPHNAWGSSVNNQTGKLGRACRDAKKVAVIVPGQADLSMAFLLSIPPNTLNKHWAPYLRTLAGQNLGPRKVDVSDVVTRITFDPQTVGSLNFQPVRYVSEEEMDAVIDIQDNEKAAALVGKTDTPRTGALPAPQAAPALSAPAPAPQAQPFITPQMQQPAPAPQNVVPMFQQPAPVPQAPAAPAPRQRAPRKAAEPAPAVSHQLPPPPPGMFGAPVATPAPQQMFSGPGQTAPQAPMFGAPPAPPQQVLQGQVLPPQHGMVNAPPPPADIGAALAAALNLPTGG